MHRMQATDTFLRATPQSWSSASVHSPTAWQTLADAGANVSIYLTRNYGHFPPSLVGPTFSREAFSEPVALIKENKIDCVIPQSIDWAQAPWAAELLKSKTPIFSPTGEAMRIERERDFARKLCADSRFRFRRLTWRRIGWKRKRFCRNTRSRSSSRTRFARRQVRFTPSCAKLLRTRGRGCGR